MAERVMDRQAQRYEQKLQQIFVAVGVLPILLVIAVVLFSLMSDYFLSFNNIVNVLRQSSYLTIVALGQMVVMVTAGFDLSVGSILAVTSVTSALAMSGIAAGNPDAPWLAIGGGVVVGFACGLTVGIVNGLGVALLSVSPFIMTLGMASVGFCAALYLTAGMPVRGIPYEFADTFGSGGLLGLKAPVWVALALFITVYLTAGMPVRGIPYEFADTFGSGGLLGLKAPVWVALVLFIAVYLLMTWTRYGRHFYAVGGNIKAAALSGVNTRRTLFLAYAISACLASIAGLLLTARMETGEANIGTSMPLQSIAACVIAGVSLRGGTGKVPYVVLGALFFGVVENGMNVSGVSSYLQIGVTGLILIFAAVADEFRRRLSARTKG